MSAILECPDHSVGELRFRLFGILVRVHPWFWLTTLIMGANDDLGRLLIWVGVCFVSILVHELGHVVAFRMFGEQAEAVLYAWGGLAVPNGSVRRTSFAQVVISLAGPAAGFLLAAVVLVSALFAGAKFHFGFAMLVIPNISAYLIPSTADVGADRNYLYWNVLLNDLLYVNIYWGLVNLLPIYPLDGGQASRALFERHDPSRGLRRSLFVSVVAALAAVLLGWSENSMYLMLLFGILAAGSAQMLEAQRHYAGPRRYRQQ